MSSDRQRLKSAVRCIALTPEERRQLLGDSQNKGGKPRSAGVGGGTSSEEGDNITNETRICCDGSVGDPNPGVNERDTDGGDQDGLDPNDPPNLGTLDGGCLTGVTNCDTGEPICFCGDGFVPPDGWEEPNEPPVDATYTEGMYWSILGNADDYRAPTRDMSAALYLAPHGGSKITGINCFGDFVAIRATSSSPLSCEDAAGGNEFKTVGGVYYFGDATEFAQYGCGGSTADYCNPAEEEILADAWPEDGCVSLAIKGGQIVGSKFDPENDGSYSAPRDEIHLCDGTNDMYLKPSASGGWKTIDSTRQSGYLFGKNFKMIAHIDGNEYSDPTM